MIIMMVEDDREYGRELLTHLQRDYFEYQAIEINNLGQVPKELQSDSHYIVWCLDADSGIEFFKKYAARVQVVFMDYQLPEGKNGEQVLAQMLQHAKDNAISLQPLRIILNSGQTNFNVEMATLLNDVDFRAINKLAFRSWYFKENRGGIIIDDIFSRPRSNSFMFALESRKRSASSPSPSPVTTSGQDSPKAKQASHASTAPRF